MTEKKQIFKKKKLKGAFFFFCKVINTRGRIKVVQLTLQRTVFVLSIHAAHDFHKQQRVLCFPEKESNSPSLPRQRRHPHSAVWKF